MRIGALLGLPDGFADGMAEPRYNPQDEHYPRRPRKLGGVLVIGGLTYRFVSGGAGWSIPYGHFPLQRDSKGEWGKRHDAMDIGDHGEMDDPQAGHRDGMEMHAARSNRTGGCVGILERFDQLREKVTAMIEQFGAAWLHITPTGVSITPWQIAVVVAGEVHEEDSEAGDHQRDHRHIYRHRRVRYAHHRPHKHLASS